MAEEEYLGQRSTRSTQPKTGRNLTDADVAALASVLLDKLLVWVMWAMVAGTVVMAVQWVWAQLSN